MTNCIFVISWFGFLANILVIETENQWTGHLVTVLCRPCNKELLNTFSTISKLCVCWPVNQIHSPYQTGVATSPLYLKKIKSLLHSVFICVFSLRIDKVLWTFLDLSTFERAAVKEVRVQHDFEHVAGSVWSVFLYSFTCVQSKPSDYISESQCFI